MGEISSDNVHGLILALASSIFIGSSFIIKKKGIMKAGASGTRAGWPLILEATYVVGWDGEQFYEIAVIIGEIANFAAYAFAPAILVTPLEALSIIVSAVLAHYFLDERMHIFGVVGCVLCLVGSTAIVLNAPHETQVSSVKQVWYFATEPGFTIYASIVLIVVGILIYHDVRCHGKTHLITYLGICSLMGSLTVMCVKAVGIAIKLSFSGHNQFKYFQTWFFTVLLLGFCLMQLNYLNKALDMFNTNVVSPVYYVMFTTFTILASVIMFKDWDNHSGTQIATELCGFVTILCGTFLLHQAKDTIGSNQPEMSAETNSKQVELLHDKV